MSCSGTLRHAQGGIEPATLRLPDDSSYLLSRIAQHGRHVGGDDWNVNHHVQCAVVGVACVLTLVVANRLKVGVARVLTVVVANRLKVGVARVLTVVVANRLKVGVARVLTVVVANRLKVGVARVLTVVVANRLKVGVARVLTVVVANRLKVGVARVLTVSLVRVLVLTVSLVRGGCDHRIDVVAVSGSGAPADAEDGAGLPAGAVRARGTAQDAGRRLRRGRHPIRSPVPHTAPGSGGAGPHQAASGTAGRWLGSHVV